MTASKRRAPRAALPQKRNAENTRERILQAAIAEFSSHGFNGGRVERICRAAKANPRMIYHYFGGKAGTYVAVLEHVLGQLRAEEMKHDVDGQLPLAEMLRLFNFIDHHFGSHPELVSLLTGENLLRAKFLRRSKKTPIVASPVIGLIQQLLKSGEEMGVFRRGIDPLHLYVVMVALSYFHRSNAHTLSVIFSTDLTAPDWVQAHHVDASDMLVRFLSATPSAATER